MQYQFFEIVERAGITGRHMARLMGISDQMYSRVKTGETQPSLEFVRKASVALAQSGIRTEGGDRYTIEELFFAEPALT